MINNRLLDQDSTTSPSGRSGFANHQNRNWAALGESMNRVFSQMQATLEGVVGFAPRTYAAALFVVMCGLGFTIFAPAVPAQKPPIPTPTSNTRNAQGVAQPVLRAAASKSAQQEAPPQQAVPPATQEQAPAPAAPPQVTYEAGQLTIVAENSKLSDVMSALRACTGADVDLPAGSSSERIWARLGPGPARQILATLLGGTKLDYVIQASESDPDGIKNVWLTRRTEGPAVASARPVTPPARPLPPRLSDAERRVPVPNRIAAEDRAPDDTASPDPASPPDAAPAVAPQPQPAPADAAPAAGSQPQPAPAEAAASPDTPPTGASKPPTDTAGQMIQTLQNMYEQRKQMQLARPPQGQD